MKKSKIYTFLIMLATVFLPIASFAGAITSTLAWYTYDTYGVLDYNGTAVSISELLSIGIVSDIPELENYGLKIKDGIAWSEPGAGLTPEQINIYLRKNGYATDCLNPLTSGEYDGTKPLLLTAAPSYGVEYNDRPGEKSSYVKVPLAFRVTNSAGTIQPNKNVWLTNADIMCREYENLKNGVRLHFGGGANNFILHPGVDEPGYLALAGLQDLNGDKYYDYNEITGVVYMYGQYTGDITYTHVDTDTPLHDINNTGHTTETTFCSHHHGNTESILSYDGLTFKYVYYEALSSVAPTKGSEGQYTGGKPVCTTSDDETGIGYTDMTLWIEGWDHYVYDKASGYRFLMDLTFTI